MIRGFYSATSGLMSQQTRLDTIANNMANASTNGFKPQQTTFSALLYANVNGGLPPISTGHGVRVQQNMTAFEQGTPQSTERDLDFAILGDGFFAVEDEVSGNKFYTRDGNFRYKLDGETKFLTDAAGRYVLDPEGERVELEAEKVLTTQDIGVFTFKNSYGLDHAAGNSFVETASSGEGEMLENPDVKRGYLEASKTDIGKEMARMIEASKAFSLNAKVVTTADEIEQIVNQLR